jgi:hypothetical protein
VQRICRSSSVPGAARVPPSPPVSPSTWCASRRSIGATSSRVFEAVGPQPEACGGASGHRRDAQRRRPRPRLRRDAPLSSKASPQQAFSFRTRLRGESSALVRHRTPSNSASLKLARRVQTRSLVRQAAEQVEASGVPEKAARILPKRPAPAPCQRRLLLAEDDMETRRLLGAVLRRQGFEVVEACDGLELLDHISPAAYAERRVETVRALGRPGYLRELPPGGRSGPPVARRH